MFSAIPDLALLVDTRWSLGRTAIRRYGAFVALDRVAKVLCYVVRDGQLLVFRHRDYPEAGVQVPAGTLHEGEDPAVGALRETEEETGHRGFRIVRAPAATTTSSATRSPGSNATRSTSVTCSWSSRLPVCPSAGPIWPRKGTETSGSSSGGCRSRTNYSWQAINTPT